jgi:putative ABC transport system permease protein
MIWSLAFQSLRLRPLRTFLTALGIAVAVGSTVIFLSLGEGLRQVFTEEIGGIGPDLQVSYGAFDTSALTAVPELPLRFAGELRNGAERYGITRVTPIMLYARGGFSPGSSFLFQGLPPGTDVSDIYFDYEVVAGRGLGAADRRAGVAVIGEQVAARNGLELGGTLRLNPENSFEIVGVARSGGGLVDNAVLVPLRSLQEAVGIRDRVSFFALDLEEPARAAETAQTLSEAYPELGFQTRGEVLSVLERGVRVSDVVRLGISAIALIVGAIAVANTVLMSVFERTREFGVIRAVGAKPRFLFGLVLSESVLLSLVGAAFGLALGRLGIGVVNRIADDLIGLEVAALTLRLGVFAVTVAFAMGVLAGLLPAARAARIPIAVAMARE